MDHVVYLDAQEKELEALLTEKKAVIIRGADGRKLSYDKVDVDDTLYFINNNNQELVQAKARVISAFHSKMMTAEKARRLVGSNQEKLFLTERQLSHWVSKRYIVLVEVGDVETVKPFRIDKNQLSNMDDWFAVDDIETVKL